MKHAAADILRVLDQCCDSFAFPMLDNGYVYLAATRLSLFRSTADWAMVIEVFGYSVRAGAPDLNVSTFASTLRDRDPPSNYVNVAAHQNYLRQNPHNESRYFHPVDGDWIDPDEPDHVMEVPELDLRLRGRKVHTPSAAEYAAQGIELCDLDRPRVFEVCRYLAAVSRDEALATEDERRVSVLPDMLQVLRLDEWHHPDLANDERLSELESFQQLARVLETGDAQQYRPSSAPNTHWRFWLDGGQL